jgi:TRAP-type C4-dicarboxylate transport system permease small subunit
MCKTTLFAAAAAAFILLCVGGWVASTPNATAVAATPTWQIDIMQLTVNAKDLPTQHFRDMTFVF